MTIEFTDTLGRKRTGQVITSNRYDIVVATEGKIVPEIPEITIIDRTTNRAHNFCMAESLLYTWGLMGRKRFSRVLRFILAYTKEYMEGLNEY